MSKRFGRNQKRKMRQQIEVQFDLIGDMRTKTDNMRVSFDRDMKMLRQEIALMRQYFEDTANILGDEFIAAHACQEVTDLGSVRNIIKPVIPRPIFAIGVMSHMDLASTVSYTVENLEMNGKQAILDQIRAALMIRYSTPRGDFGLSISDTAWNTAPVEILARECAADLEQFLIQELSKKRRLK